METDIRGLLLKYGPLEVHAAVDRVCRQLYEDLGRLYGPATMDSAFILSELYEPTPPCSPVKEEPKPTMEPPPIPESVVLAEPIEDSVKEIVLPKRVIKKKKVNEQEPPVVVPLNELVKTTPMEDDEQKRIKANQRKAVTAKFDELTAKHVDPNTLLTKENLESWLKEGKTYSQIARDHVGLHESIVSKAAKEFGLESKVDRGKVMKWVMKGRRGGKA